MQCRTADLSRCQFAAESAHKDLSSGCGSPNSSLECPEYAQAKYNSAFVPVEGARKPFEENKACVHMQAHAGRRHSISSARASFLLVKWPVCLPKEVFQCLYCRAA